MKHVLFLLTTILWTIAFLPLSSARADTWAVYWYLCGSDLESRNGSATDDLVEAANADLPGDVTVVIQTGGSKKWEDVNDPQNNSIIKISPNHLERYIISEKDNLKRIQRLKQASMGKPETLAEFLSFCTKNYPADHAILIIWDHGGGSAGELASDQNFSMKGLSSKDLHKAFAIAFGEKPAKKPFDIIGFDACLMGSLGIALEVKDFGRYMVASQEVEPGYGWSYTDMLTNLGKNTSMPATEFGKIICDTYLETLKKERNKDFDPSLDATLSLIDLNEIDTLKLGWDILGFELFSVLEQKDMDTLLSRIGRAAESSENFYNSKSQGFSNMMDLGSFVHELKDLLPETSTAFLDQLNKTVLYKVSGQTHRKAHGISCYYPYDGGKTCAKMLVPPYCTPLTVLEGIQRDIISPEKGKSLLTKLIDEVEGSVSAQDSQTPSTPTGSIASSEAGLSSIVELIAGQGRSSEEHGSTAGGAQSGISSVTGAITGQSSTSSTGSSVSTIASAASAITGQNISQPSTPGGSGSAGVGSVFHAIEALTQGGSVSGSFASIILNGVTAIQPVTNYDPASIRDAQVTIDKDGDATLNIGKDKSKYLESVYFYLAVFVPEDDIIMFLGKDADLYHDWDNGVFTSHFRNTWASIDGNYVSLDVIKTDDENFYYLVPIKLNNERCNLQVVYNLKDQEYKISGARRISNDGIIDKFLIKLKKGDTITTIFEASTIEGDDKFKEIDMDTFTIGDKITMEDIDLGDANYVYLFEMNDIKGNSETSEAVFIAVENGKIKFEK